MNMMKSRNSGASLLAFLNPFLNSQPTRETKKPRKILPFQREEINRRLANKARIDDLLHSALGPIQRCTHPKPKVYSVSVRPSADAMKAADDRYRRRKMRRVERWLRNNPDRSPSEAPSHIRDWA